MNNTKHAHTNFTRLLPFLDGMKAGQDNQHTHRRYESDGYMPLVLEYLHYSDYKGRPVYSMTHYGEQNGDAMRDPDMTFSVDWDNQAIEPQTFQNDYLGIYQEVYRRDDQGRLLYSKRLRTDLDEFLWQWLQNIEQQGYELKTER